MVRVFGLVTSAEDAHPSAHERFPTPPGPDRFARRLRDGMRRIQPLTRRRCRGGHHHRRCHRRRHRREREPALPHPAQPEDGPARRGDRGAQPRALRGSRADGPDSPHRCVGQRDALRAGSDPPVEQPRCAQRLPARAHLRPGGQPLRGRAELRDGLSARHLPRPADRWHGHPLRPRPHWAD